MGKILLSKDVLNFDDILNIKQEDVLKEDEVAKQEKLYYIIKISITVFISILTLLTAYIQEVPTTAINIFAIMALIVSSCALVFYLIDWISIKLYILQIELRPMSERNYFLINAKIINYGGRIAFPCTCEVKIYENDKIIERKNDDIEKMDFVPVDTPVGRPEVLQKYQDYPLLPKIPIWVRKYETLEKNQKVEVLLRYKGYIRDERYPRQFRTPCWKTLREAYEKPHIPPGKSS